MGRINKANKWVLTIAISTGLVGQQMAIAQLPTNTNNSATAPTRPANPTPTTPTATTSTGASTGTSTSSTSTTSGTTTSPSTSTTTPTSGISSNTVISINNAAQAASANRANNTQGQGQSAGGAQQIGMIIGIVSAGFCGYKAYEAAARKSYGEAALWGVGAVASIAVAMSMMGAKKKSDQTVADSSVAPPAALADAAADERRLAETERKVASAISRIPGMSANLKTGQVKLPDGRKLNVNDLGNAQAMAAAGFSGDEISKLQSMVKQGLKEGEKAARGVDTSLGDQYADTSGGGSGKGGASGSVDLALPSFSMAAPPSINRDPAQVAGLTKDYNGEKIGVASENLFTLINRRYENTVQRDQLLVRKPQQALPSSSSP